MAQITSFAGAITVVKKEKSKGKKVGLITGCFDIIHFGHIETIRYAKKHCNFLVVGIDSDKSVQINKGKGRPVFSYKYRSKVLSELKSIDLIFPIKKSFSFGSLKAEKVHETILKKLNPDYLITNPLADSHWQDKMKRANKYGTILLLKSKIASSTHIIQKLNSEF